jgi:Xaa-Pro dipeptidase
MRHFMNYEHAREKMRSLKVDALLLSSPEGFFYATGFTCMLLDLFRQAPLGLFLLPAEENSEAVIILPETDVTAIKKQTEFREIYGFPVWWEAYPSIAPDQQPFDFVKFMSDKPRKLPAQHDPEEIFRILADILEKRGLISKRIGVELEFMSARMLALLQERCPNVQFVDCTSLMVELRQVKTPEEIVHLREACKVTEAGLQASAKAIRRDAGLEDLNLAFKLGVLQACKESGLSAGLGEIGGQPALGSSGLDMVDDKRIIPGMTVKYDMQVSIDRYYSDIGRTYLFGEASREQEMIYRALLEAHTRMGDVMQPGTPICRIYQAARETLDRHGLSRHARGHFGHSVGLDRRIEEPPFICSSEKTLLEKGMVLAVETPFYFEGIGKFQIEDMVLMGESGPEIMNTLSKDWIL